MRVIPQQPFNNAGVPYRLQCVYIYRMVGNIPGLSKHSFMSYQLIWQLCRSVDAPCMDKEEVMVTAHLFLLFAGCCSECINLDVSSMLAWVSALTHGGDKYTFEVSADSCPEYAYHRVFHIVFRFCLCLPLSHVGGCLE